jgi:ribonuclease BN (tRNA processing enzyme)
MPLSFVALGVGDAFSALHYSASVAVEADGRWLLVDCPHPIRKILREGSASAGVRLDVGSFEAVVLTHLHADHAAGLEGLGYYAHFVLGKRARLAVHPLVLARLWDARLAGGMDTLVDPVTWTPVTKTLDDYFEVVALDEARPVQAGPFEIACRRTRHHIPTFALRIRAAGRTLALSADTAFDPALVAWLAEADLVLHETGPGIHTPYEKLAALPQDLRRRMRLIHFPDELDASEGAVEPLVQGRRYEVPGPAPE